MPARKTRVVLCVLIKVVGAAENCTWPYCAAECMPCNTLLSYDCTIEEARSNADCGSPEHLSTNGGGILGSCTFVANTQAERFRECACPSGYCKDSDNLCTPQVCFEGAHPPEYKPSFTVQMLSHLAVGADSPAVEGWMHFLLSSSYVPLTFLILGLIAAGCSCSCIAAPGWGVCCDFVSEHILFCLAFLLAVTILVLAVVGFIKSREAVEELREHFTVLVSKLSGTAEIVLRMMNSLSELTESLVFLFFHQIAEECPFPLPQLVNHFLRDERETIVRTDHVLRFFNAHAAPAIAQVKSLDAVFHGTLFWKSIVLVLLPLGAVIVLSSVVVVQLALAYCMGRRLDCIRSLAYSMRAIVMTTFSWCNVLFVAIAATMLASTILFSGFCHDVDQQMLGFPPPGTNDSSIVSYYISGNSANPLRTEISTLLQNLDGITSSLKSKDLRFWLEIAGKICPVFNISAVELAFHDPMRHAEHVNEILHVKYVWPYYDTLVHEALCDSALTSLGVATMFVCLTSVCLWPLLSCTFSVFLKKWNTRILKEAEACETCSSDDLGEESKALFSDVTDAGV